MLLLTGPEFIPAGKIKNIVILLHGLGSNGDDLMGLVPMMSGLLPNTAFLAPNAPLPTPFSASGYQWFEYWDRTMMQISDGIKSAAPLIVDYIDAAAKRFKVPNENIILCGFSQGCMMALHTGLRLVDDLGGIIGLSGVLMNPETLLFEKVKKLPPVLLAHGLQDTVVPALASYQAEIALKSLGVDVKYIQRPYMGHSIDDQVIKASIEFCQKIFKQV